MQLILFAIAIMFAGGAASLVIRNTPKRQAVVGASFVTLGCALGAAGAVAGLFSKGEILSLSYDWSIPYASFSVGLDAISSLFLIPIFVLTALAAIYGYSYLRIHDVQHRSSEWFHYCVLAGSMALVIIARNAILFLFAWELMAISSFFLVTKDNDKERVRDAGWIYLVATHIGTVFLLIMFSVVGARAGTFDFAGWRNVGMAGDFPGSLLFMLALIGFGTKAGIVPLHVWLPKAHPAAPSYVSAVMSGVMIKTGIYGFIRMTQFFGPPPMWWGWLLVAAGIVSGVLGVVYAISQHDIKSLLAYHSVENIGIILMGLGLGFVGLSNQDVFVAVLGFGGALLHVVNHAIFKGLLFMGAGAVIVRAGTGEIDLLGGVIKKMPVTGAAFLTGAAAISGLPPLNGFISEFLIYAAAFATLGFQSGKILGAGSSIPAVLVIFALLIIGGLASACFSKVFGIVFLGQARSDSAKKVREVPIAMIVPKLILAAACLIIGLFAPVVLELLCPAIAEVCKLGIAQAAGAIERVRIPLYCISYVSAGLIVLSLFVYFVRTAILRRRGGAFAGTWDCGYAAPVPTMQYTSSSYARPVINLFRLLILDRRSPVSLEGPFPREASFESHSNDMFEFGVFRPLFEKIKCAFLRFRFLQHGDLNLYVLYIAITLLILLAWKFGAV